MGQQLFIEAAAWDANFAAYAAATGQAAAPNLPDDTFFRPLFDVMAQRLARYPLSQAGPDVGDLKLRVGVMDAPSPNAFADRWGVYHIIGLNTGLLLSAIEAASLLQDKLDAFTDNSAVSQPLDLAQPLGIESFLRHVQGLPPRDEVFGDQKNPDDIATIRAKHFVTCCIQFVCLHEFGHIACGHLGWKSFHGDRSVSREIGELSDAAPKVSRDCLRFFEHEADVFALETMLRTSFRGHPAGMFDAPRDDDPTLVVLAFLTTVFTWISLEDTFGRRRTAAHPLSADRLCALPMALMGLIEQDPSIQPQAAATIRKSTAIIDRLAKRYPRFAPLQQVLTPHGIERADQIVQWMRAMDDQSADRGRWRL